MKRIDLLYAISLAVSMLFIAIINNWLEMRPRAMLEIALSSGFLLMFSFLPLIVATVGYFKFSGKYGFLRFLLYAITSMGVIAIGYAAGSKKLILIFS